MSAPTTTVPAPLVRGIWQVLEPVHAVLYYAPEVVAEVAEPVYSFSPVMVAEHRRAAWTTASPDGVLAARLRGVEPGSGHCRARSPTHPPPWRPPSSPAGRPRLP
jgi:hypothetical protein